MDDRTFDDLARALGSGRSRRGLLKAIGGAALGMVGVSATSRGVFANAGKVGICHVDGQGRFRHISVNANSVSAHLAHGDYTADTLTDVNNCGACGNMCDEADACTSSACVDGVCEYTNVPVDCAVNDEIAWSACSAACGGGTQTRTLQVIREASCGGAECPALEQSQPCNTHACEEQCDADLDNDPENCGTCGTRCDDDNACTTDTCVDGACVNTNVPVDCVVSDWSEWGDCSAECDGGTQTQTRTVIREASCGGAECPALEQSQACNTHACEEQCDADTYNDPDNCGTCGTSCDDGDACTTDACVDGVCVNTNNPVDCVLAWPEWPPCPCEGGFQTRFQQIVTRASCGGEACPSPLVERRFCPAVDTQSDENNCGACGIKCSGDSTCVEGVCRVAGGPRR